MITSEKSAPDGSKKGVFSLRRLFKSGFWSIADQGLFAVSNFIINIFLARWLSLNDYGAFAASFSVFLLLGTLHTAIITEPLLIYGSGKYRDRYNEYIANLFQGHIFFTAGIGILLLLISLILYFSGQSIFSQAFLGLSIAQPFILLSWLLRRTCYTRFVPRIAAFAGLGYLFITILGIFFLYTLNLLSPLTALMLMGIASLIVSLWMMAVLFPIHIFYPFKKIEREMLLLHLKYGKWSLPSSALTWIPANIYYVLLPFQGKVEIVAILRAQNNLLMPLLQFNTALATQIIPIFVQYKGTDIFRKLFWGLLIFLNFLALAFWFGLNFFRNDIILCLYGDNFISHGEVLMILGFLPLLTGIIAVLGGIIRANDHPEQVFWSYLFASIVSLTAGIWLMHTGGLIEVAIAIVLSYSVVVVIMGYFNLRDHKSLLY